jgi:toxin ParE1/3/4
MSYQVYILEDAEQDIKDVYYYVAHNDSKANALKLIDELETACFTLDNLPERGIAPHELKEIGGYRLSANHLFQLSNYLPN